MMIGVQVQVKVGFGEILDSWTRKDWLGDL